MISTAAIQRAQRLALARPVAAITLLFLLTTLPGLGSGWLWDRDETWYASCAYNMIETGDWIVPAAGERTFLEKPPLAYWAMAAAMEVFGVGEFAARFPSVLWGLGTVLLVYWFGTQWRREGDESHRPGGTAIGLIAAAVMGTHIHFAVMTRAALVDPPLIFFMTAGLACWWRMQEPGGGAVEDRRSVATRYWWWCLLGGAVIGAAVLAKGPLGLFPGVVALAYVVAKRDFSFFLRAKWALILGVVAIVVVAVPWYWAVWSRAGAEFGSEFIVEHNLGRFKDPMQGHEGPFVYYVPVVILGMLPWSFFLATMWHGPRRRFDRFDLMLAMWAGVPFLFFSFTMATKLPHYIAFSFPALALLVAREIEWRASAAGRFAGRGGAWLAVGWWLWVVVGLAMIVGAFVAPIWVIDFPHVAAIAPGVVLAGGFLWAAIAWHRGRDVGAACWRAGTTMAAFLLVTMNVSLPRTESVQTLIRATITAVEMAEADDGSVDEGDIFVMGYYEPSLFFYTSGKMIAEKAEIEVRRFADSVESGRVVYFICRRKHLPEMLWYIGDGEKFDTEVFEFDSLRDDEDKFNIRLVRGVKR